LKQGLQCRRFIHLRCRHFAGIERSPQINRRAVRFSSQPAVVIAFKDNHRHSVVQRLDRYVRVRGNDCRRQQLCSCFPIFPLLPWVSQGIYGWPSFIAIANGCLFLRGELLPFVERISRHKTAPVLDRLTECRSSCDGLCLRVDRTGARSSAPSPNRDTVGEFPTNRRKLPQTPFFGNYVYRLGIVLRQDYFRLADHTEITHERRVFRY
jgi:hypothetical protein